MLGEAYLSAFAGEDDNRREATYVAEISMVAAQRRAALLELPIPMAEKLIRAAHSKIMANLDVCESPIEAKLLPALVFANYGDAFASFPAQLHIPKDELPPPRGDLIVIPQFAFIRSRLDFAVIAEAEGQRKFVAIECDGAEFHKDATKDRMRDDYLIAFGFDIFRFSGRQIQADPLSLAAKVGMHLADWRASL